MEKIHKNIRVFMLSCIKHACFHVFSPFSAYFFPHDIIAEKGLLAAFLQCRQHGQNGLKQSTEFAGRVKSEIHEEKY